MGLVPLENQLGRVAIPIHLSIWSDYEKRQKQILIEARGLLTIRFDDCHIIPVLDSYFVITSGLVGVEHLALWVA
jgi:hypothetical protein